MKNKILILGSGFVSRPAINYLLQSEKLQITVASNELEKAESFVKNHKNGKALFIDINDGKSLNNLIAENDIIVSLLPYIYHPKVASICLLNKKNMVTTSYVSQRMIELESDVLNNNLLFLNEIGVDPGIDHMTAKRIIDRIQNNGGKLIHFYSYCGGLPAPINNNNPFGYKFSWSPKGVLLAQKNSARYFENGELVEIENKDLYKNLITEEFEDIGLLEVYPNRDSTQYKELYNLNDILTIKRGTYRYHGWGETMTSIRELGLLDDSENNELIGKTYHDIMLNLIDVKNFDLVEAKIKNKISSANSENFLRKLIWLDLFSDKINNDANTYLDLLSHVMQSKMQYAKGEIDLLIMKHEFIYLNKNNIQKKIESKLIDYGIPFGDSSMSRTVSLPLAIAVKLIAEEKIKLTGVRIPIYSEIYEPVLNELEKLSIKMIEREIY